MVIRRTACASFNATKRIFHSAMKNIHSIDEQTLLEAIICEPNLKKRQWRISIRDMRSYEQLKRKLEIECLSKQSTLHLQLKFNSISKKQEKTHKILGTV